MPRDPEKYLYDMKDAAAFLLGFVEGRSLDDLRSDRAFRSAVERELMIIGEALFQLDKTVPEQALRISEHRRIIHFRHILVHAYDQVDAAIIWAVLTEKLPIISRELDGLLPDRPPGAQ